MSILLITVLVCVGVYWSVSWFLPKLLSWFFKQKFHIKLHIGRIAVPKFILKDVSLSKNGFTVHMDEISLRSSLFNSDMSKLLSVMVRDVRVDNSVEGRRYPVVENILKPLLSKQNSREAAQTIQTKLLDFRDKKLPPSLLMFAQFMAVHVHNISVMVLHGAVPGERDDEEGWLLHATADQLHVDAGAAGVSRSLLISASLLDATAKLLPRRKHLCLGELSCGISLEGTLKACGPLSVEKVHATLIKPTLSVHESLYSFVQERRNHQHTPRTDHDSMTDVVARLSPVIPKIFYLKVDTTTLSGVRYNNVTEYQASLECLQVNSRFSVAQPTSSTNDKPTLPQVYVAFQIDQLKLTTSKEKLLFLNKLKLDAKLEKSVLNLYLILSVLSVTYNHEDVFSWYSKHFVKRREQSLYVTKEKPTAAWMRRVAGACVVQGCAELRGATLHARTRRADAVALSCAGLKIKLDQHRDTRSGTYSSTFPRLLLANRHWSTELLVDSGRLAVGSQAAVLTEPPAKKPHTHSWGDTLFLGVALVKWGSHGAYDAKVEAMMDCLRIEWSKSVGNSIITALDCVQHYRSAKTTERVPKPSTEGAKLAVNITLSHINVFSVIEENMCLMTRIDAVSLEKNTSKSAAVVSGLKIVDMVPYKGPWPCQRADEIVTTFFHLKLARIEHVPASVNNTSALLDVQFLENVYIEWGANLHLKIMAFLRAFQEFKGDVKRVLSLEEKKKEKVLRLNWSASFKGESTLGLILSRNNYLHLTFDDLAVSIDDVNGLSIVWNQLKTALNEDDIVHADGFVMERVLEDSNIRVERIANENFMLEWNQVWGVTIESLRLVFPHRHRFAEAIQGEFVSLFKWLKLVHDVRRKPFTADSPLPSDLQINIEEIIMEMSDDPFEVKLRDNYELLEDEYKESQKRRAMLDAKIQELCKPHLFLPAGKVEELEAALRHKDAQIYVQRHRAAASPRTRLVACVMSHLHILALADPVYHGTDNVVRQIQEMDADSPWPEEGLQFSTLWCRGVSVRCGEWQILLRDFPQPLLSMRDLRMWGTVAGAEQTAASRAYRTVRIEQGDWGDTTLERSMMPLKFYYDLCCEITTFSYSFGPCWEPVIAQCNMSFEQVSCPSLDPSLPLAWWDKVRLLMHGRLTAKFGRMTCLLHVSLDPYNTTEEMELTWTDLVLDWTNAKLVFRGDLNVFVRTASKYDDCRLLHLPGLKLNVKLGWQCAGDPRDHHAAAPCAPDKLPEYSSNQEHDSFRAFRSQGLDLNISLDTKPEGDSSGPVLLLYGSTLRWFESLKLILSGVTRPTRRGKVFRNERPRRPQLSRHYRAVSTSLTLHNLQVFYWSSSSMQRGVELSGARLTCGSRHALSLVPTADGLVRRPRAVWTTVYMNCDLNDAEMWLKSATAVDMGDGADSDTSSVSLSTPVEKCYCLSVSRVSYGREAAATAPGPPAPTHRLAVQDLRGAWTNINRDVAFALFDTYIKTKQLKKNLSTKALKEEEKPTTSPKHQRDLDVVSPPPTGLQGTSPGGGAEGMLAQLVAEAGAEPPVVFSDDLSGEEPAPERPAGQYHPPKYWLDDDTAHTTWLIELVNSQVLLKGCETRGYVILCAARAEVRQRVRRAPAAAAWSGAFTCMQYYATVSDTHELDENIQWVSVEEIEERSSGHEISTLPDVPRLVGSGHSAGGVIGSTVGPSADKTLTQLQRIVSRCACEFYYVSYDDEAVSSGGGGAGGAGWTQQPEPYDAFTLMHHDLDVCTNSLQYAMLLDVVNNLVLHVEPERRRTLERRARMRFQLQLHKDEDPRLPIQRLQNQVRESLARLRRLEKESYLRRRALADRLNHDRPATEELKNLDIQVNECKEQVWTLGEELDAMVRAWREVRARRPPAPRLHASPAPPHRLNEICFKSARWRLTDADGQLGIADLVLTNFLYTKTSRSDDSVEHQLELGYIRVTNLLPREPFPEVLAPQAPCGRAPLARRAALRLFCRDRPPVGGISVKEHFEVNVVPIKIGLTKKFFNTMLKFCFPERDPDTIDAMEADDDDSASVKSASTGASLASAATKKSKKKKDSNFYVKIEQKDDVEKMKERAEKNKLFIYIKIPEVPVRVSYKGSKEKNLEDVRDLPLVLPTLEYHNVTWTWLDLLLATKTDTKRVIVSQAIRQKLQLHRRAAAAPEPQEEDKARLLLGDRTVAENKPQKKSVPRVFKLSKS